MENKLTRSLFVKELDMHELMSVEGGSHLRDFMDGVAAGAGILGVALAIIL